MRVLFETERNTTGVPFVCLQSGCLGSNTGDVDPVRLVL